MSSNSDTNIEESRTDNSEAKELKPNIKLFKQLGMYINLDHVEEDVTEMINKQPLNLKS